MDRGAVRGPVVGQYPLDGDSVPGVELDRSPEERDHGWRLVVSENFGVGQAAAVIDRDVDVFPAGDLAVDPGGVSSPGTACPVGHADDAGRGAALDPAEFLDVDVNQLPRTSSLVALGWLEADASELAHSDAGEDPRYGRYGHAEYFGDLRSGESQPSQRSDRLHLALRGSMRDRPRRRGSVHQPELALGAIPAHPLAGAAADDLSD